MKEKLNKEKGITLVALIITIIVLVILAAVTIKAAFQGGILDLAAKGAENYAIAQTEEENMMNELENFIKDNLDSFVNSEVREDIEVIVTDDGSKDSTRDIVKEYEKKYPGIVRLIEQKNAGPGSTVNSGIKHAKGKYFRMVDGDDWVDTKNLKPLIEFLKNNDPDIVVTKYTEVYNGTDKTREVGIPNKLMNQILDLGKNCEDFEFQMHNTTYKTELLQKNNIVLDNGFYTDVEYLILPFPYVKTVAFLDLNLYMYRLSLEGQSVSLESMQKNRAMHETVLKRILRYYEENKQKAY